MTSNSTPIVRASSSIVSVRTRVRVTGSRGSRTIDTDDLGLGTIIACQKALVSLRLGDLDSAAKHLAQAQLMGLESVATRVTAINLRVQRARVALGLNRKLSVAEALSAQQDAIALRREMIAFGRWSEAGQLLMLAADVSCMLDDPDGGEQAAEAPGKRGAPRARRLARARRAGVAL